MIQKRRATLTEPAAELRTQLTTALSRLEKLVAAVNRPGEENSAFDQALAELQTLAQKEGIPIAIVGGMAAIKHGYERFTQDIDIVVGKRHLDTIARVAPKYGIKVVWKDPAGWHKLSYGDVRIEVVPEGGKPKNDAPTVIPGPKQLGVGKGVGYASIEGWVETKLGAARRQDQADVVQVLKQADPSTIERIRRHIAGIHSSYLRLLEELVAAAEAETQQEKERGGRATDRKKE